MRRGLMQWREDELSADDVGERIDALRKAMKADRLDAFVAYTTLVRPAAVNYFTGFTPYWSDGLLLVLPQGRPQFVTALSKRVGNWLGSVNPTCDILHSPKPGKLIGDKLREAGAKGVGAVELDMMPGILIEDLIAASSSQLAMPRLCSLPCASGRHVRRRCWRSRPMPLPGARLTLSTCLRRPLAR